MLWYKAWLETRARFLAALGAILLLSSFQVLRGNGEADRHLLSLSWHYEVLHRAHSSLAMLWVLAVSLLMMGGLIREMAVGASDFTLALPVSRAQLMRVRIGMGFLQAITLAVAAWIVMFLLANLGGDARSLENAGWHLLLLVVGGSVFVSWALLVSTLIPGEYTAPAVCLGVVLLVVIVLGDPPLNQWSPSSLLTGNEYLNRRTMMLGGPIPWVRLTATVAMAALMAIGAVKVMQRREF